MGDDIIRVHDVLETKRAAMVVDAIRNVKSIIKPLSKSSMENRPLDTNLTIDVSDQESRNM